MTDETRVEVQDDSLGESDEDKTSDEKNEIKKELDGLPSEDDLEGKKEPDKKVDRSEIAQKIKYREQLKETRAELEKANDRIAELESRIGTTSERPNDEKELAAQKYIRDLAHKEAEAIFVEREKKEKDEVRAFEESVDEVLEDNPELSKDKLLEVIEEFDVSPEMAVKILQKFEEKSSDKKPKMPSSKRGSINPPAKKTDDRGKSMYDIARELGSELKQKITG